MARGFGSQSMIAPLKKALLRSPIEEDEHVKDWRKWGYYRKPDVERAREEHEMFMETLRCEGVQVFLVEDSCKERLDAVFTSDTATVTDKGAVILRMGKELRRGEEEEVRRRLVELGVPILGEIHGDATLEGGDILWLDRRTVVVGRSYRSNSLGFDQFKHLVEGFVEVVEQVDLPHWHGPGKCLHLLSLISMVDEDLAVAYPELIPVPLAEKLRLRGVKLITVPPSEFKTQGCNVLTLKPRKCVMVAGNTETRRALEREGAEVIEFEGEEICINREGGPTCMVCSILREY